MEKFGCVEPFFEENRKAMQEENQDDKRRILMKDKNEQTKKLNLSKIIG